MKSLINIPLLKEQLKRFWAIAAVLMIIYILVGLIPVYSVHSEHPDYYHMLANNMVDLLNLVNPIGIIVMLLSPILAVMALYPYYFNNKAATAFHSFPLNKRQLFCTNIVAALILMLLPLLIFCLTILAPVHYPGLLARENWDGSISLIEFVLLPPGIFPRGVEVGAAINSTPVVAGFFGRVALGIIFYYGVFLLAASIAGNRVIAILLSGALPLIPVAVHGLIQLIAHTFVFGFEPTSNVFRLEYTMIISNPAVWGLTTTARGHAAAVGIWPFVLSHIVIAAVLFAIAYICTHKRKLERTEDSVVFTPFKNVCVFLVAAVGMFLMGGFLFQISHSFVGLYVGSFIGFVIAYFIGQMIAEKALDVRHKIKTLLPFAGTMLGIYVFILLFANFGLGFYINRVPLASEVARASIHHDAGWGLDWGFEEMLTDDPVAIALTLEAHQQILNNRSDLQRARRIANRDGSIRMSVLPITYLLNDGTILRRVYWIPIEFRREVLGEITRNPSMILSRYQVFNEPPEAIEELTIRFWFEYRHERGAEVEINITDSNEIASLLNEAREDYVANHIAWATEDNMHTVNGFSIWIRLYEDYINDNDFRFGRWSTGSSGDSQRVQAWLERYGYLEE